MPAKGQPCKQDVSLRLAVLILSAQLCMIGMTAAKIINKRILFFAPFEIVY